MIVPDPNRTARMCAAYKAGMPVREIANKFEVQNPAVWKALRRGGVLPPYQPSVRGRGGRPKGGGVSGYTESRLKRSADSIAATEAREPPRPDLEPVDRDPCFMCGIRADIGCKHRAATGNHADTLARMGAA